MNNNILTALKHRPAAYEPSAYAFWDDDHISKGMLAAHLDPEIEAATRKPDFVSRSAGWIAGFASGINQPRLLDLGCGPGIYAELFAEEGFDVTGIDISRRSLAYAREHTARKGSCIDYIQGDYRGIDYDGAFDIVTLIYCDFGVLSPLDRAALLRKIHKTLKPDGRFITDVCSLRLYEDRPESTRWSYEDGGFWSEKPYACLHAFLRYDETGTYADRYVIVDEDDTRCYNIWNHRFSKEELLADFSAAGFADADFFSSAAGDAYTEESDVICAVAFKENV
ncbi:MAG: class I SAM-dependent methyltransferase [Clostridiales bacterium]|nr:class I SAM-dependent methyltransferase [Clostridiales bacterium]